MRPVFHLGMSHAGAPSAIAVMFDFVNLKRGGRATFDGRHGLMKPEERRKTMDRAPRNRRAIDRFKG